MHLNFVTLVLVMSLLNLSLTLNSFLDVYFYVQLFHNQ